MNLILSSWVIKMKDISKKKKVQINITISKIIMLLAVLVAIFITAWFIINSNTYEPIKDSKSQYKSSVFKTSVSTPVIPEFSGYAKINYREKVEPNKELIYDLYIYPSVLGEDKIMFWVDEEQTIYNCTSGRCHICVELRGNMQPVNACDKEKIRGYEKQIRTLYKEAQKAFGIKLV